MIHFKTDLKDRAVELLKAKDNADLAKDLGEIDKHLIVLETHPIDELVLASAQILDKELHEKYRSLMCCWMSAIIWQQY